MTNFNDLPKDVRERIYRLHLCREEPITDSQHRQIVNWHWPHRGEKNKCMPPLLASSPEIEEEAAPFYYSENIFHVGGYYYGVLQSTHPRHLCLIRHVVSTWVEHTTGATHMFDGIQRLKGLNELTLRVEELKMVRRMLRKRKTHQRFAWQDFQPTPQQQLAILQFPGMVGLLRLSGIPHVYFTKTKNAKGEDNSDSGPIPGGVLEMQVAPKIMKPRCTTAANDAPAKSLGFPFFSLSAELRNRIYDLLLCFPGPIQPTTKFASSASKQGIARKKPSSQTVLSLLLVNRQIHDEACGIFYHYNSFVFEWTTHLHCFLTSLGPLRQSFIRDLTIHYIDVKSGGISLVELTFPLLRNLKGLRKFEVILHGELAHKVYKRWWGATYYRMSKANPAMIPGLPMLFTLRGITDIKIRDMLLEERVETAKKSDAYPDFEATSFDASNVKLHHALEHFNAALADAQQGKVNTKLLEDNQWQMWDEFPSLEAAPQGRPDL